MSLFPFEFRDRGPLHAALHYLLSTWQAHYGRADLLSNILLYLPLGLFGARAIRRAVPVATFGLLLSFAIEFTQFYVPGRAPEMMDVYANFAGASLGALAGALFPRHRVRDPFALLLIAIWLANRFYPYLPPRLYVVYDLHFDGFEFITQLVLWLAAAMLIEELLGAARGRRALAGAAGLVLLGRALLPDVVVSPADILGPAAALLIWIALLSRINSRARILATLFTAFIVADALRPFTFLAEPRPFGWVPFLSLINGPRGHGTSVFLLKMYEYGAFLWLIMRSGWSWTAATVFCSTLVFGSRLAQTWLPGRSAEITDTVLILILAAVMRSVTPSTRD